MAQSLHRCHAATQQLRQGVPLGTTTVLRPSKACCDLEMGKARKSMRRVGILARSIAVLALFACADKSSDSPPVGAVGTESGGDGGAAADVACVALDEICMDDHAGARAATISPCCDGSHCGSHVCTNSVPPHCYSLCACAQAGQNCREELNGHVTSEHACCAGLACTGCLDVDAESRFCVCRPR